LLKKVMAMLFTCGAMLFDVKSYPFLMVDNNSKKSLRDFSKRLRSFELDTAFT